VEFLGYAYPQIQGLRVSPHQVVEVRSWKDELLARRRNYIEKKLVEAEEKRQRQLKMKVKKAHEEETKVMHACS